MENKLYMALRRSWWYGFAFHFGMVMFLQDYIGLEDYIALVRLHWVNIPWIVGLLIATCGLYFHYGLLSRFSWLNKMEKDDGARNTTDRD